MSQTKIESYCELRKNPLRLSLMQENVLRIIARNPYIMDKDIAMKLGWSINRVTARRNELLKKNRIKEAGTRYDSRTNRRCNVYEAVY